MPDLSDRERRFVEEYLIDLNGTRAYLRAFPDANPETARRMASRLLTKVDVEEAIIAEQQIRSERTQITADMVVRELAVLGFADLSDYVEWGDKGVTLKASDTLDETKRRAVIEVSEGQHGIKIKLGDKKGALDSLGRHLGIFAADNAQAAKREITLRKAAEMSDDELAAIAGIATTGGD